MTNDDGEPKNQDETLTEESKKGRSSQHMHRRTSLIHSLLSCSTNPSATVQIIPWSQLHKVAASGHRPHTLNLSIPFCLPSSLSTPFGDSLWLRNRVMQLKTQLCSSDSSYQSVCVSLSVLNWNNCVAESEPRSFSSRQIQPMKFPSISGPFVSVGWEKESTTERHLCTITGLRTWPYTQEWSCVQRKMNSEGEMSS